MRKRWRTWVKEVEGRFDRSISLNQIRLEDLGFRSLYVLVRAFVLKVIICVYSSEMFQCIHMWMESIDTLPPQT